MGGRLVIACLAAASLRGGAVRRVARSPPAPAAARSSGAVDWGLDEPLLPSPVRLAWSQWDRKLGDRSQPVSSEEEQTTIERIKDRTLSEEAAQQKRKRAEEQKFRDDVDPEKEKVKRRIEEDVRRKTRQEIKEKTDQAAKEVEENLVNKTKADVEAEVRSEIGRDSNMQREIKEDLSDAGFGHEERMSEAGLRVLEQDWFLFLTCLMVIVFGASAVICMFIYFGPQTSDTPMDTQRHEASFNLEDAGEAPVTEISVGDSFRYLLQMLRSPVSILLIALPAAAWLEFWQGPSSARFWATFVAIIPLATYMNHILDDFTRHFRFRQPAVVYAAVGNIPPVIAAMASIRRGHSLGALTFCLGSVVSRELLLLGTAVLLAGASSTVNGVRQFGYEFLFDEFSSLNLTQLLIVGSFSICFPASFNDMQDLEESHRLVLSRAMSFFLFLIYAGLVVYTLQRSKPKVSVINLGKPEMTFWLVLSVLVMLVGMLGYYCVSVTNFAFEYGNVVGFSGQWILFVVLPSLLTTTHFSCIHMCMKGHVGFGLEIALHSVVQLLLLSIPLLVLLGWVVGQPVSLSVFVLQLTCTIAASIIVFSVISDGRTNWLRGFSLVTTYLLISVLFFFVPDRGRWD